MMLILGGMSMRWWWRRRRPERELLRPEGPAGRVPDGDMVPIPGYGRWVDLLAAERARREAVQEHTRIVPIITRGQRHRGQGGRP